MSNYVKQNLLPGEKIIYYGHRHWIVFVSPILWLCAALLIYLYINIEIAMWFALIIALIGVVTGLSAWIDYTKSEIDVTTERIFIKIGWLARSSIETDLRRIASIDVIQTIWGRILNFGTVIVCDVGNTKTPFVRICDPFKFRRAVLTEVERKRKTATIKDEGGKGGLT